jgi:pilus assembly protein CpaE
LPQENWQVIVISPHAESIGELRPLLAGELVGAPVVEMAGYPAADQLHELPLTSMPTLCFLDAASNPEMALPLLTAMTALKANLHLVALVGGADPNLILQCLRAGAQEFLTRPYTVEQMRQVIEKLSRLSPSLRAKRGRVTVVVPAKGACGATTVAANLAVHLQRVGEGRVLLADLDPLTGTVSFLLKLRSTYSFLDALQHAASLDDDLWRGMVVSAQGIDVLLPPENPVDSIHGLPPATAVLEFARRIYDHVVIDLGTIFGAWTVALARVADEVLVVSTNELGALHAASRGMHYLEEEGVPAQKTRLIINRLNPDAGLTRELIEMALHTEVYHVVPSDYASVQRALLDGKAIPASTAIGRSLLALAQGLLGKAAVEPARASRRPATGGMLSGSLSSLLKAFSRG